MNSAESKSFLSNIIILLVSLYGIYINYLYINFDNKGVFISAISFLWLVLISFILFNRLTFQLLDVLVRSHQNYLIIAFFIYFLFSILLNTAHIDFYFKILLNTIYPFFLLGFLSNVYFYKGSSFYIPLNYIFKPLLSKNGDKLIFLFSFTFIVLLAYKSLNSRFGDFSTLLGIRNDYYQDLGDYYVIFYCTWLYCRDSFRKFQSKFYITTLNLSIIIIIIIEVVISAIFLQLFNSNKAPFAILLIAFLYIIFSSAQSYTKLIKIILTILLISIFLFLIFNSFLDFSLFNDLRFFKELQTSSLEENPSWTSRSDQFSESALDQMSHNILFGDLSIAGNYLHSTFFSIQTHLGLIGSLLFWGFISINFYKVYSKSSDNVLKAIFLPIILVSVISSVFWWPPLWFLIGVLFVNNNKYNICELE